MPQVGLCSSDTLTVGRPVVSRSDLAGHGLTLPGAELLQVATEIDDAAVLGMLPPALHPTIPPMATIVFWRCPTSDFGPFTLAQVRISCRAGFRSRGLLAAAYCDNLAAAEFLSTHWAFDCRHADVVLRRQYHRVEGTVTARGQIVLRVALLDPQVIAPGDVEYSSNLNPARLVADGLEQPRLVQAEPEYLVQRADRGLPEIDIFDLALTSAQGIEPTNGASALYSRGELRLPPVRFLVHPELSLTEGVEHIGD